MHPWQRFFAEEAPRYLENIFTKNTDAEVDFVLSELDLEPGSRLLDLGCGVGRHAVRLAAAGLSVTGVDLSHHMLEQAASAFGPLGGARSPGRHDGATIAGTLRLMQGNAAEPFERWRPFSVGAADSPDNAGSRAPASETQRETGTASPPPLAPASFDACICLCEGAFSLLSTEDDPRAHHQAILRNVHSLLRPGGRFLLNALSALRHIRMYTDADVAAGTYDPYSTIETSTHELADGSSITVREKGFMPAELDALLVEAGFRVDHLWGGTAGAWNREPVKLDEYELMAVCAATPRVSVGQP